MRRYNEKSHVFVVCAYGESPYLEACIQSLLAQIVQSKIYIVTSTPNEHIKSIAKKYNLPVRIHLENTGIAADWNFAYDCADTQLVTIAHQDDIYYSDYLQDVLEAINYCNSPLIVFTNYHELRENKVVEKNRLLQVKRMMLLPLRVRKLWRSKFIRRRILSLGNAVCCPSVTFVKDNLMAPLFENNMKSNIDWQAWEKISRQDGEFVYLSRPLIQHRIHGQSTTSELLRKNGRRAEDVFMYQKFWPKWVASIIEFFYQRAEESNRM